MFISLKDTIKQAIQLVFVLISTVFYASAGVILPDPACGFSGDKNCLVYDDFTVFSMSFYNII